MKSSLKYTPDPLFPMSEYGKLIQKRQLPNGYWQFICPENGPYITQWVKHNEKTYTGKEWAEKLKTWQKEKRKIRPGEINTSQQEIWPPWFDPKMSPRSGNYVWNNFEQAQKNAKENIKDGIKKENTAFPGLREHKADLAILCGGGPSLQGQADIINGMRDLPGVKIVTTSCSQNYINGHYYMGADPVELGPKRLNGAVTKDTYLVQKLAAHPDYRRPRNWKKTLYYTDDAIPRKGVMTTWPRFSVMFDAFQFAVRVLRVSNIMIVGCEATTDDQRRMHAADTWNITDNIGMPVKMDDGTTKWTTEGYMGIAFSLCAMSFLTIVGGIQVYNGTGSGLVDRCIALTTADSFAAVYKKHLEAREK